MHGMTQYDQMYSVREAPWHIGSGTNVLMLDRTPETRMARMELPYDQGKGMGFLTTRPSHRAQAVMGQ